MTKTHLQYTNKARCVSPKRNLLTVKNIFFCIQGGTKCFCIRLLEKENRFLQNFIMGHTLLPSKVNHLFSCPRNPGNLIWCAVRQVGASHRAPQTGRSVFFCVLFLFFPFPFIFLLLCGFFFPFQVYITFSFFCKLKKKLKILEFQCLFSFSKMFRISQFCSRFKFFWKFTFLLSF